MRSLAAGVAAVFRFAAVAAVHKLFPALLAHWIILQVIGFPVVGQQSPGVDDPGWMPPGRLWLAWHRSGFLAGGS